MLKAISTNVLVPQKPKADTQDFLSETGEEETEIDTTLCLELFYCSAKCRAWRHDFNF